MSTTLLALAVSLAAPVSQPQREYSSETASRIVGGALTDGVAYARLAELTDTIGPRLSGSPGATAAVSWALRRFQDDGVPAHPEPLKVPHWVRGEERAEVLPGSGAAAHPLAITALGGSPGTPSGGITAEVVEVRSLAEVAALRDKVKGKIVFYNHAMSTAGGKTGYGEFAWLRVRGPAEAAKVGAVAAFVRSLATASLRSPHTGVTIFEEKAPRIPAAALATEDAELLHRLLQRGPVRVRLGLGCRTLGDADSANVVAEVRGRERSSEVVLIGAHLDSWDLATGAVDDGAGAAIVMEAMRLLVSLPSPPRRTIRAVLFMNEENGLAGAKAYAAAHAGDEHVAALEADGGAARALSVVVRTGAAEGRSGEGVALLKPWMAPLEGIGVTDFSEGDASGADIAPLTRMQVPIVQVLQDASRYFDIHHSAADTLDKVRPQELAQAAAAIAWVTYALAEMPHTLPRLAAPGSTKPAAATAGAAK